MKQNFDIYTVFNFFVTANHSRDYLQRLNAVDEEALKQLLADEDIRDCRDVCDKGKHLTLTKRTDPEADHTLAAELLVSGGRRC